MTSEGDESPAAASATERRRHDTCVWLGALASWRGGLVKELVRVCEGVDGILDLQPRALHALVRGYEARERSAGPRSARRREDGWRPFGDVSAAEVSADERRFASLLDGGPRACARSLGGGGEGRLAVAWSDSLYPPALRDLHDPPLCLFARASAPAGEVRRRLEEVCSRPAVAVVGTRAPSPYGREMAALLGADLTVRGLLVVSGLAMGIDAEAQAAAVRAAGGRRRPATVAVLGCGADVVYPRLNAPLFARVAAEGLLVSEFAWGVQARPWRFPARNRVMAALSLGVVLVEGAARSGARITADFALDLGREVLAVPGEAGKRLTQAPHQYVRNGAALCESAADVLAAVGCVPAPERGVGADGCGQTSPDAQLAGRPVDERRARVLRALERGAMRLDEVAAACGLGVAAAGAILGELEVDGLALVQPGGAYRLKRR